MQSPVSREQRRAQRAERLQQAWKEHYFALVNGQVTLAELLQHPDQKLMQVADKGLRMLKLGKYDAARKILSGLVLLDPYVPYFHLLLGGLHDKMSEVDDALAEYDQIIELCESMNPPGSLLPCGLLAKAKVLIRLGNLGEAAAIVRRMFSDEFPLRDPRLLREARAIQDYLVSQNAMATA
jgi:tetratricopeptide (TPR) repeat protein